MSVAKVLKMIKDKEGGKVSDEALKLIVKISEGSVRDALSLLDRGLVANQNDEELNLDKAQSIYGYFDKSSLIELIKNLFTGDEKKVFKLYRKRDFFNIFVADKCLYMSAKQRRFMGVKCKEVKYNPKFICVN